MKITREDFKELITIHKDIYDLWKEMQNYLSDDCFDRIAYPVFDWLQKQLKLEDAAGNSLLWEAHDQNLDEVYDNWVDDEVKYEGI